MEYRQLGRSGLRVPALTLGTMTFGGHGNFPRVGETDVEGAAGRSTCASTPGVNLIDTADVYSGGLGRRRSSARPSGSPRRGARRDQGRGSDGRRAERRGALAPPHHPGVRGEPAAAGDRPHRPLPGARVGRPDAARGDAGGARPARRLGQGPLRRLLELRGLAADEGARHRRPARVRSGSSASRSTTRCRPARPSTSWCPPRSTRVSACSSGARSPAACCRASTGAAREGPPAPAAARPTGTSRRCTTWRKLYDIVELLVEIADGHGVSAAQVALAWLLGRPAVASVIIGARTEEQLADNLAAADLVLSESSGRASTR